MARASRKYFASLLSLSGTPQDSACVAPRRVLHEIAQASEAVVQFFLGRRKFLCRSPTTIPVRAGFIGGGIRLPLQIDCLHARISQVLTRHIQKSPEVGEIPDDSVNESSRQPFTSSWQRAWCC